MFFRTTVCINIIGNKFEIRVEKTNQPAHFATYNVCTCGVYYPTSIIDYINSKFILLLNTSNTTTSSLIVPNLSLIDADLDSETIRIANFLGVQVEPFRIKDSIIPGCIRSTELNWPWCCCNIQYSGTEASAISQYGTGEGIYCHWTDSQWLH